MNNAAAHDSESKRMRLTAIVVALFAGIFILALKFYAAKIADSSALRSDALEGAVNVIAAAFGLGSLIFAEKPADKDHPYGHGKIEYFASAFEGGLITLAGFLIFIDAITRIIHPHSVENLGEGLKLNLIAGALNGVVGLFLYWVGKKYQSQILKADGIHLFTDLITTAVLAVGLTLVLFTGWTWLDPILALAVSLFLFRTGYYLVKESSEALLDAEKPELIEKIAKALNQIDRSSVIAIHELKVQQFGRDQHIDLHVVVPEFISIKEAHDLSDAFAIKLHDQMIKNSMIKTLVHTHIDPCEKGYCTSCKEARCPVRVSPFESQPLFNREGVTAMGIN